MMDEILEDIYLFQKQATADKGENGHPGL